MFIKDITRCWNSAKAENYTSLTFIYDKIAEPFPGHYSCIYHHFLLFMKMP